MPQVQVLSPRPSKTALTSHLQVVKRFFFLQNLLLWPQCWPLMNIFSFFYRIIVSVKSSTHITPQQKQFTKLLLLRGSWFATFRYLFWPRKISAYILATLYLCKYICQIFLWYKVMSYRCLNNAIYNCWWGRSVNGVGKQPILSAYNKRLHALLSKIVA